MANGTTPSCHVHNATVIFLQSLSAQQEPRERIDVSKLGPQVGQEVPDFALKDQYGTVRSLNSLMGPKGAMLVFFRSADW
jgi:hypothetical protein